MSPIKQHLFIRLLFFFIIVAGWQTAFCQPDYFAMYSPTVFSLTNRQKVEQLEKANDKDEVSNVLNIQSLCDSLNLTCSNAELYALVSHPNKNIRQEFLPTFANRCKNQDSLLAYLQLIITDGSIIYLVDRCLVHTMEFGEYAYSRIARYLDPIQKRNLQLQILEKNSPEFLVEQMLQEFKATPENYSLFRSLVVESKQFKALEKLLSYQDTNDRILILSFLDQHRNICQQLMLQYPLTVFDNYVDSIVKNFSSTQLMDAETGSLFRLIEEADSWKSQHWIDQILTEITSGKDYFIAQCIYRSSYYESNPDPSITLTLLPSLYHVDSTNLVNAFFHNPSLFDQKIKARFHNSTNAFDLETALHVFPLYFYHPTNEKKNVCIEICKHSIGPELIEAIDAIKSNSQQQIATILEQRFHQLKLVNGYNPDFHPILSAIAFLDDTLLNRKLAIELTDSLILSKPKTNLFIYLQIIRSSNDSYLLEKLFTHLEHSSIDYYELDFIRFFLEQPAPEYHERLVKLYQERQAITYTFSNELYLFKSYLIQYGLIPYD